MVDPGCRSRRVDGRGLACWERVAGPYRRRLDIFAVVASRQARPSCYPVVGVNPPVADRLWLGRNCYILGSRLLFHRGGDRAALAHAQSCGLTRRSTRTRRRRALNVRPCIGGGVGPVNYSR